MPNRSETEPKPRASRAAKTLGVVLVFVVAAMAILLIVTLLALELWSAHLREPADVQSCTSIGSKEECTSCCRGGRSNPIWEGGRCLCTRSYP